MRAWIETKGARAAPIAAAFVLAAAVPALAQGWQWPWGGGPPVPREPVYRAPLPPSPPAAAQPYASTTRPPVCLYFEQQLAQEGNRGAQLREQLPKLEADIRVAARQVQSAQIQLDRMDCFEQFFFSRTLRRTRQCVELNNQMEVARQRLADLDGQRQQIMGSSERSHRDDIIRELARNNCGASYQQEASRRSLFSSFWPDEEDAGGSGSRFSSLPFATYRTICVRLCDGYYFPISYSTLPEHFDRDADACKSKCAAPAELFYHQNPGEEVKQAVSYANREPYAGLKTAFLYRDKYVQGCSCKQAEYAPGTLGVEKRAEGPLFSRPPSEPKR